MADIPRSAHSPYLLVLELLEMSHTGIFQILDLTYRADPGGQLARAMSIKAMCASCGCFSVWGEEQMEHVPGGTVLACPGCGVRQAISNARLSSCPASIRHPAG